MLSDKLLHFFENVGAEWILYILLALGVLVIAVVVERMLYFRRNTVDVTSLSKQVMAALREGGPTRARAVVNEGSGMTTEVLKAAFDAHDDGVDAVEEVIQAAIIRERIGYDRFLSILGTLGNSAPFIGLLGTVIGIVTAFSALGSDVAGAQLKSEVMSHIGEALVATAIGLAVAIPAVIAFNWFKTRIKVMAAHTESAARILLAHLKSNGGSGGGGK